MLTFADVCVLTDVCCCRLRELSLSRNDLEAEGARLLAPAIPSSLTGVVCLEDSYTSS
jgi:hypothetical protein